MGKKEDCAICGSCQAGSRYPDSDSVSNSLAVITYITASHWRASSPGSVRVEWSENDPSMVNPGLFPPRGRGTPHTINVTHDNNKSTYLVSL